MNETRLEDQLQALERIANDKYSKLYPRKLSSSSTGLTAEQLRQVRSEEFQKYLIEEAETSRFKWFSRKDNKKEQK